MNGAEFCDGKQFGSVWRIIMSETTKIAWTDHTFNPWMGCTKVSPGCTNCYAETLTKNRMGLHVWGPNNDRQITKSPWNNVLKWNQKATKQLGILGSNKPHLVFCGSLCDWAEDHPTAIATLPRLFNLIRKCSNLHFQLLTKRADRIEQSLPEDWGSGWPNVWLGTSIENNDYAWRADHLRTIPAIVRFVSYEPALGPLGRLDLNGLDWIIYGGESGPGYRPENKQWAHDIRGRCYRQGIAFFHKQSAAYRTEMGIELDGEIIREFPEARAAGAFG